MGSAYAHFQFPDGSWAFKYYTRSDDSQVMTHCINGTGTVDPIGVMLYAYGEYSRMFDQHLIPETSYEDNPVGGKQWLCGYDWSGAHWAQESSEKHGAPFTCARYHFRLWWAPHAHEAIQDKYSVISPHHENCPSHDPDLSWESASIDVVNQMCTTTYGGTCVGDGGNHHSAWWAWYYRDAPFDHRGFWQDGYMDRLGGLHDNVY